MKIDAHQHFWKYSPVTHSWISEEMGVIRHDFLPDHLRPQLAKAEYEGCVAVQASQSEDETTFLLNLADQHDFIKGVVGWVDLRAKNAEERLAHFAKHPKLVGIRHVVQDEPDDRFLLGKEFLRGISYLKQFDLKYDILIFPKHLSVAEEFVRQFPDQPFVLDHVAKPFIKDQQLAGWDQDIQALAQHPNVFCKLSGMVTEADHHNWKPVDFKPYLDVVFEAFTPDRLMIGSDWPVCRLAGEYGAVMQIVEDYVKQLSPVQQANVLGENARRFYGF